MKFYVTEDVFNMLPNAEFGLVSVKGANNQGTNADIQALLENSVKECEAHFDGKKVKNEPEIVPYREAFKAIGINPNRYMCSAEALMSRIAKGQGMPQINSIVDLGNAVSLKYRLPIGAHDLDTMEDGAFGVRVATSDDTFLPFGAEEREEVPEGEVVYATGNHVRTRRWTWRQGDEGKITEETGYILFIVDGFEDRLDEVLAARDELAALAEQHLGGTVKTGLINKNSMEFDCE